MQDANASTCGTGSGRKTPKKKSMPRQVRELPNAGGLGMGHRIECGDGKPRLTSEQKDERHVALER